MSIESQLLEPPEDALESIGYKEFYDPGTTKRIRAYLDDPVGYTGEIPIEAETKPIAMEVGQRVVSTEVAVVSTDKLTSKQKNANERAHIRRSRQQRWGK